MDYPKTKQEWWETLEAHWDNIWDILSMFLPLSKKVNCHDIQTETTMAQNVEIARKERSPDMVHYLNAAWWKAPDNPSIHSIPSWGVLCDLCSESYLIEEDVGEPTEENLTESQEFVQDLLQNFPFTEDYKKQKIEELTPDWMREGRG